MAYTQSHLDALQEALASGTLTVTFEGRCMPTVPFRNCSVRFRSCKVR